MLIVLNGSSSNSPLRVVLNKNPVVKSGHLKTLRGKTKRDVYVKKIFLNCLISSQTFHYVLY